MPMVALGRLADLDLVDRQQRARGELAGDVGVDRLARPLCTLALEASIEVADLGLDLLLVPFAHRPLIHKHLRVEVEHQAKVRIEHALVLKPPGIRCAVHRPRTRGVLNKRAALRGLASEARDGAQRAVRNVAVVAGKHVLLECLVEPQEHHDLGHARSRNLEVFGDRRLHAKGLVVELPPVLASVVEPPCAAFELVGLEVLVVEIGVVHESHSAGSRPSAHAPTTRHVFSRNSAGSRQQT